MLYCFNKKTFACIESNHEYTDVQLEGGQNPPPPPRNLANQLTLFKLLGDYASHTTASPPDSKSFLHL